MCKIHVCVVMPDHVHILLTPLEIPNLGYHSITTIIHSIKSYSSIEANRLINRQEVFWQREYFDRIIRSESDSDEPIQLGRDWLKSWKSIRFCMKRTEEIGAPARSRCSPF